MKNTTAVIAAVARRIVKIVTHPRPHLDELFAIWLLKMFGEALFPGVSTAEIITGDNEIIMGLLGGGAIGHDRALKQGILLVGIGGGRFDEHGTAERPAKGKECAATLVANALDMRRDQRIHVLLSYVLNEDLTGEKTQYDLANICKLLTGFWQDGSDVSKVYALLAPIFDAELARQEQRLEAIREVRGASEYFFNIPGYKGMCVLAVRTDNPQCKSAAFHRKHGQTPADIVIIQSSTGGVGVFTNDQRKDQFDVSYVARHLRLKEMDLHGRPIPPFGTVDMDAEGVVAGSEEWYYHKAMQAVMNGSLTAPRVTPTLCKPDVVLAIVEDCTRYRGFLSRREERKRHDEQGSHREKATEPQIPTFKLVGLEDRRVAALVA